MRKSLFLLLCLCLCVGTYAQKEWNNWYLGGQRLLTFQNGPGELRYGYATQPDSGSIFWYPDLGTSAISYSDPATGNLKFLVALNLGFNNKFNLFPDDHFLRACPGDKMSYHIIPFAENPNKYYVVQFQSIYADLLAQETQLQVRCPNAIGLGYSVVDMSQDSGLGNWERMNQTSTCCLSSQITTVKHANGKDVWVIVHAFGSSRFASFLFTSNGVQAPVYSDIGPYIGGGSGSALGYMTANHAGNLLAVNTPVMNGSLLLFDFNNSNGTISNYRTIALAGRDTYIMQFSPDDSKLYCIMDKDIWQYDFNQADIGGSATRVFTGPFGYLYDMQLGPDGKIYFTKTAYLEGDEYVEYMGAIQCPNLPQYACNVNGKALYSQYGYGAFPDLINDFVKDPKAPPVTKFDLGSDVAVCFGSYTIMAPAGWESYRWNTGDTGRQITVTKPGLYYVLTGETGFSCPQGYGYINITDKAEKLNLGDDVSLCAKTPYKISIPAGYSNVMWENGSHTKDSVITNGGTYIISANDKNGCFTKDTIGIYYKYYPGADFGPDTTFCNQSALTLQLQPAKTIFQNYNADYTWQDGSKEDKYTVTKSGTYWGTVTYDGCTVSDTIRVNYITAQGISLGNDTTLCSGDILQLKPDAKGVAYTWSTGAITPSISVSEGGSYWVKLNNGSCTLADTIQVVYHDKPQFSLGADRAICQGNKLVLQSPVEGILKWQDGAVTTSDSVKMSGWYWLDAKVDGCSGRDSVYITVNSLPQIHLGNDTGICEGNSLQLDAFSATAVSYLWQDGSTQPSYKVIHAGTYSVQATSSEGCTNADTIQIAVVQPPLFSLGNDTVICDGQRIHYHFTFTNAIYHWSDGSSNPDYDILKSGYYSLTVTQQGCGRTDNIIVNTKPLPVAKLGNDTTLCEGQFLLLGKEEMGVNYTWQDGSQQALYKVSHEGTYQVTADLNGCQASDAINISYKQKPHFTLGTNLLLCKGQELEVSPHVDGVNTYLWQDGSTLPKLTVKQEGLYSLSVTNECGTSTDHIRITEAVCAIQMPSAFTPNKDGINDLFQVKYPGYIKEFKMVIFTRWGQKIAEITNPYNGWDGSYKSVLMDAGTYVWKIWLTDKDGKSQSKEGTVVLLR